MDLGNFHPFKAISALTWPRILVCMVVLGLVEIPLGGYGILLGFAIALAFTLGLVVRLVVAAIRHSWSGVRRPAVIVGVVWAMAFASIGTEVLNNRLTEGRMRKVVAAVEQYRTDLGRYPEKARDLVPRYLDSLPHGKWMSFGWLKWEYVNLPQAEGAEDPFLYWTELPPFGRRTYDFTRREYGYLD